MLDIAVLEPDRVQAEAIMRWLEQAGHRFTCCSEPVEFLACLKSRPFDLLLVDCSSQQQRCFEMIEHERADHSERTPLLYLAQADSESDIISALTRGADDYVVKPLNAEALLNRIHVLVGRFNAQFCEPLPAPLPVEQFGPFKIDRNQRLLLRNAEPVTLTDKDFCLADFLFSHPNQLLSRHRLLSAVWGVSQQVNTRTVDMHISRLRKALRLDGSGYEIQTVHQQGYRLYHPETE